MIKRETSLCPARLSKYELLPVCEQRNHSNDIIMQRRSLFLFLSASACIHDDNNCATRAVIFLFLAAFSSIPSFPFSNISLHFSEFCIYISLIFYFMHFFIDLSLCDL